MCLTIPGKIESMKEGKIVIDYGSEKRIVEMSLEENINIGDYVIVSNKMIVSKIPKERAEKFMEMIK